MADGVTVPDKSGSHENLRPPLLEDEDSWETHSLHSFSTWY